MTSSRDPGEPYLFSVHESDVSRFGMSVFGGVIHGDLGRAPSWGCVFNCFGYVFGERAVVWHVLATTQIIGNIALDRWVDSSKLRHVWRRRKRSQTDRGAHTEAENDSQCGWDVWGRMDNGMTLLVWWCGVGVSEFCVS